MKKRLIQQGDVLIVSVEEMPDGKSVQPEDGNYILAKGEVTGHAHRIENIAGVEFVEKDGMFYIRNKKPITVTHEEHKPVTIPSGIWKVGIVREYDHFTEEVKNIAD